ncbi:MAG: helix-turn-helix transcriptional regulator [Gloeobacteraceae cyanobacterium ES-bin-316]|nr:helix-turn-helix transcriptional regulator [Ferruginibacter sp.]
MNEFADISKKIKFRRKFLNYSQKDISELTGISERTIRSIENGEGNTSILYWYKILDVLGLEMKILFKSPSDETRSSVL